MQRWVVLSGWALLAGLGCGGDASGGQRDVAALAPAPSSTPTRNADRDPPGSEEDVEPPEAVPPADDAAPPLGPIAPAAAGDRDDSDGPAPTVYAQTRQRLLEILERNCGACHGRAQSDSLGGELQLGDDLDVLVAEGYIIPLSREESVLMQVMEDGSMPPPGTDPRPTPEEIELFGSYIENRDYWPSLL